MNSKFDQNLEKWATENDIQELVYNKDVFVRVDKYNKPVDSKSKINNMAMASLSKEDQKKLRDLRSHLPHEEQYFRVDYNEKNSVFFLRKKTPIQSMLNVWAVIIIIWALYRWYFRTTLPIWFDEFIAKPAVFLIPLYYYITKVEKKNFIKNVSLNKGITLKSALLSITIGLLFLITGFFSFYKTTGSSSLPTTLHFPFPVALLVVIAFATAITEEILSRGFVLKRLYKDSGNPYTSSLIASVLFFVMHIPILMTNDLILGTTLLQIMATDLMLSFAVSLLYIQTESLYVPIIIHAFYNLSLYFFHS